MDLFILFLEIVGIVSFALSGAVTALKKNMDIFGVCILGITAAVGGGIIRDITLGLTPPSALIDSRYILISIITSVLIFIPNIRHFITSRPHLYEILMLVTDSLGLGIFTVCGLKVGIDSGFSENPLLLTFISVVTGVGGGVLRDVFAGERPYIFVKHIYACAAIAGALVSYLLWSFGEYYAMSAGLVLIVAIRFLAAKFHWSLPKAKEF